MTQQIYVLVSISEKNKTHTQESDVAKQREFVHQHYQNQNTKYQALQ